MLKIRCLLNEQMSRRDIDPESLARTTGLTLERILAYCDESIEEISLTEVAAILEALGSDKLSDLFEPMLLPEDAGAETLVYEDDWETPCAASPDGKHEWYRDVTASSSVYQEYFCTACRHRYAFIL